MALPQRDVTKFDVIFLPVEYNHNGDPKVQFAVDGHMGNNRFSVILSLWRDEFMLAHENGEYGKCDRIAIDIVNTVTQEYTGRFLEVSSTRDDRSYVDLGCEFQAVERVKFALHNTPQRPPCPDSVRENEAIYIKNDFNAEGAFGKDVLSAKDVSSNIFDDEDSIVSCNPGDFDFPNDLYKTFEPRCDYLETNSISSVDSNTLSSKHPHSVAETDNTSEYGKFIEPLSLDDSTSKQSVILDDSASKRSYVMEEPASEKAPSDKLVKADGTQATAPKKRRKKRVIQRRGMLKFNSESKSKPNPTPQQRSSSKVNVNLGDSRFAVDPSLSEMFNKAASEGQGTDVTDLYTTNSSYCESTVSEPKRQKILAPLQGLRSTFLKKFNVGKNHTEHYSASEADIIEQDSKVKCLDENRYRDLSSFDVLCQTDPFNSVVTDSTHVGNSRLKVMMQSRKNKYHKKSATSRDKQSIVNSLVSEVVHGVKGKGNFVARELDDHNWYELDQQMACLMVKGSLDQSKIDSSVLDLPDSSTYDERTESTSQRGGLMGNLHNAAVLNLKNRKKKKTLSSNFNPESINELQRHFSLGQN